jgi:NAD-dependent deacetylase
MPADDMLGQARELAAHLSAQARVVVLSGSGMSAESGIPTFRDAQTGLWAKFRPEELATPEAFALDPGKVWRWYEHRREGVLAARPHAGHLALVRLEALVSSLVIITQNVDGLHQRSGSGRVLELHGNILRSVCSETHRVIDPDWISSNDEQPPPSPHASGALARPDVVWFGETLPGAVLDEAVAALESSSVCIAVGTSAMGQPAASLPLLARQAGARLVEINPQRTPLSSYADYCLHQPAGIALAALVSTCEDF